MGKINKRIMYYVECATCGDEMEDENEVILHEQARNRWVDVDMSDSSDGDWLCRKCAEKHG